jgi:hypothetical protein
LTLARAAEAPIPTRHGAFRTCVFVDPATPSCEHVALVLGDVTGRDVVPARERALAHEQSPQVNALISLGIAVTERLPHIVAAHPLEPRLSRNQTQ